MEWSIKELAIKTAGGDVPVYEPLGRKPAEMHPRPMAPDRPEVLLSTSRPAASTSCQVGNLSTHPKPGFQGRAIVMTSSELPELLAVADRIMSSAKDGHRRDPRAEATEEVIMHAATASWIGQGEGDCNN